MERNIWPPKVLFPKICSYRPHQNSLYSKTVIQTTSKTMTEGPSSAKTSSTNSKKLGIYARGGAIRNRWYSQLFHDCCRASHLHRSKKFALVRPWPPKSKFRCPPYHFLEVLDNMRHGWPKQRLCLQNKCYLRSTGSEEKQKKTLTNRFFDSIINAYKIKYRFQKERNNNNDIVETGYNHQINHCRQLYHILQSRLIFPLANIECNTI